MFHAPFFSFLLIFEALGKHDMHWGGGDSRKYQSLKTNDKLGVCVADILSSTYTEEYKSEAYSWSASSYGGRHQGSCQNGWTEIWESLSHSLHWNGHEASGYFLHTEEIRFCNKNTFTSYEVLKFH